MSEKNIPLTSAEIACLWNLYMNDSAAVCFLKFMLKYIQDPEIKPVIQFAFDMSSNHKQQLTDLFQREQFAIPNGFDDQDVNMEAPWLYSDMFCLIYVGHLSKV